MNYPMKMRFAALALCLCLGMATGWAAEQAAGKKPISYDVYDSWRSVQGTQLSPDGIWLVYSLIPQDGDGELVVRNLNTGAEYRHPRGKAERSRGRGRPGQRPPAPRDVAIAAGGRYIVFSISPTKAEQDEAKEKKKKAEDQPKKSMGIMDLSSGEVTEIERVKSFGVPEESSDYVAYLLEPAPKKAEPGAARKRRGSESQSEGEEDDKKKEKKHGSDLVILKLGSDAESKIAEVVEYAWTKDGSWLAYGVSSEKKENDGAFARSIGGGATRTLLAGEGNYKALTFDKEGAQLAFMSDTEDYAAEIPLFKLYHWDTSAERAAEVTGKDSANMPSGWSVSENGRLQFSEDGAQLFLGTAPIPDPEPEDPPEPIKVDIWHYKDPLLQTMQKVRANQEKRRTYRGVVHLKEKSFVQLADAKMPDLTVGDSGSVALGASSLPYAQLVSWDGTYRDHYVVNLRNGSRHRVIENLYSGGRPQMSPGGNYIIYFDHGDNSWYTVRTGDRKKSNLTSKLDVAFYNVLHDTPNQPRTHGLAGWTDNDASVLIYDRYDIWDIKPDGSAARMVTGGMGRKEKLVFRYQRLDREEKAIPTDKPLLLSTTNDATKGSGYYRVSFAGRGNPEKVLMLDKGVGGLIKAKDADRLAFTVQRFDEFPDLWVSDGDFAGMKKISAANPQQKNYIWGKSELIDYHNADGKLLQAILTKPENFDPGKKYPMMVYIYERLTNGLHRYRAPAPGTSVNITRYVSNGYVVLQPDIIYDTGYPGDSSLKCVVPAVNRVVNMGFIDPERIGIQGHSWGGYEISYMITRTDMFAAVQAGASVVNMISAYGGIRWQTGMSRAFQYERTQSRIGGPPWDNTLEFIENSPIFWVEKVNTPYMTIHNDQDGAVPWYQGIEFFSALRRLGKEAYMFNYNGEEHGLRQRPNQKHWTVHMDEFFDHYLKGTPKPEWMEKGVPYLERGQRDIGSIFKPITTQDRPPN